MESLKQLRRRLKLTQVQAAHIVGVEPNTWARWERGERTPSGAAQTLIRLLPQLVTGKVKVKK